MTRGEPEHGSDPEIRLPTMMKEGEPTPPRLALSRPGSPNRTEIELPLPPEITRDRRSFKLVDCRMLGASPTDVYLVGNYDLGSARLPLLLRFDGAAFTRLPSPPFGYTGEADLAEDGTLVVLGSPPKPDPKARSIWALRPGSDWNEKSMPVELKVREPYRPWSHCSALVRGYLGRGLAPGAMTATRAPGRPAKGATRKGRRTEQEGVTVSTLYRWARRLKLGPVKQGRGRPRTSVQPAMLPVVVAPDGLFVCDVTEDIYERQIVPDCVERVVHPIHPIRIRPLRCLSRSEGLRSGVDYLRRGHPGRVDMASGVHSICMAWHYA